MGDKKPVTSNLGDIEIKIQRDREGVNRKMKKVLLYNPGLSSMNLGDKIIAESAKEELKFILADSFVVEVSTHLPQSFYYMRHFKDVDNKFVLGSNLLKSTLFGFKRQWDVKLRLAHITKPCILVGVGWWQYKNKPNFYTKVLLKLILSDQYLHSVRDEYTEKILKSIGINNVIHTACPTMWKLTKEHCKQIKNEKSDKVIFTLTDYNKDEELDSKMINILLQNYKEVYFFPQGYMDIEYFNSLKVEHNKIKTINPNLQYYNTILENGNIDYIGTRLHGGIKALQKKIRTIIISIDNRAEEQSLSYNLPIIKRQEIGKLDKLINSSFETQIKIPLENIDKWKGQFTHYA